MEAPECAKMGENEEGRQTLNKGLQEGRGNLLHSLSCYPPVLLSCSP